MTREELRELHRNLLEQDMLLQVGIQELKDELERLEGEAFCLDSRIERVYAELTNKGGN